MKRLSLIALFFAAVGCHETSDVGGPTITDFQISSTSPLPGGTVTCTITATDADGIAVRGCSFVHATWNGDATQTPRPLSCVAEGATDNCSFQIPVDATGVYYEVNHYAKDASTACGSDGVDDGCISAVDGGTVLTIGGAPGDISAIWAQSGETTVLQDETPGLPQVNAVYDSEDSIPTIDLDGMQNEVVSFALVLEAETTAVNGVTVSMDSLSGPGGAILHDPTRVGNNLFNWTTTDIELFYVRYLEIEGISMFHYGDILVNEQAAPSLMQSAGGTQLWADRPGANKKFPDIAVPLVCADGDCSDADGAFNVEAGNSQLIWADIWIPRSLAAGTYTGNIRVDEPGAAQIAIPVRVVVHDRTMPDTPGPVPAFSFIQDSYVRWKHQGKANFFNPTATADTIINRYFKVAHRHRIDLIGADNTVPGNMRSGQRDRLDGDLFTSAQGYRGPGEMRGVHTHAIGPQGGAEWYTSWCAAAGNCTGGDAGVTSEAVNAYASAWMSEASSGNWDADLFLYLIDEPSTGNLSIYDQWGAWMTSGGSGLDTFITKPPQHYDDMTNVTLQAAPVMFFQPGWGLFGQETGNCIDPQSETYCTVDGDCAGTCDSSFQEGRDIILPAGRMYGYNGQRPLIGSHAVEDEGVALREAMWAAYKLGLEKYWIWSVNYWQDPQSFGDYNNSDSRGDSSSEGVRDPFESAWNIGIRVKDVCEGVCSGSGADCSVDMQCPQGQTCDTSGVDGDPCTGGGTCDRGYCQDDQWGQRGSITSNGDGLLMYPGRDFDQDFPASNNYGIDGPIVSLRYKHWRRGVQDLHYVKMADAINSAATDLIVANAVPLAWWEMNNPGGYGNQPQSWSSDPDDWDTHRKQLRDIILSSGGGSPWSPVDTSEWPSGPATTCTLDAAIGAECICEGVPYTSGYCLSTGFSYSDTPSNDVYVAAVARGAGNGTDWDNARAGLPSPMVRDTTYWVASGDYDNSFTRTWSVANSGTQNIVIRKATEDSHGTETGWQTILGQGKAIFGPVDINTDYWTIDGQEKQGLVFSADGGFFGAGTPQDVVAVDETDRVVLRNLEIDGGYGESGGIHTEGTCNLVAAVNANYLVIDRVDMHDVAEDGIQQQVGDNVIFAHNKIHGLYGKGTDNSTGPCYNGHSDGIELILGVDDSLILGNLVYNVYSSAAFFIQDYTQSGNIANNVTVVNNIFYTPYTGGFVVSVRDADNLQFHNNIVWGRARGGGYGSMFVHSNITNSDFTNNISSNLQTTHGSSTVHNPTEQVFSDNLWGEVIDSQYAPADQVNDLVSTPAYSIANPFFESVPYSTSLGDFPADVTISDFDSLIDRPQRNNGAARGSFAWDIRGNARPLGASWDIGAIEESAGTWSGFGGTGGTSGTGGTGGTSPIAAELQTQSSWTFSQSEQEASDDLTAVVWFRAASLDTDGLLNAFVGLSSSTAQDFVNQAAAVRLYDESGFELQARDDATGTYRCVGGTCPTAEVGTWYKVTFTVDITGGTYDATVEDYDETFNTQIANDFELRSGATFPLEFVSLWANGDTLAQANLTEGSWTPTCAPLTCASFDCGFPDDGCNGTLDCTSSPGCGGGEVCTDSFTCCTPNANFCADLYSPDKNCGSWANNCGQVLSCDPGGLCDPGDGDTCNDGVCCTPTPSPCAGLECGSADNGCGGTVNCGSCLVAGEACDQGTNQCVASTKPTEANTGPTNPGILTPFGSQTIDQPGVYENYTFNYLKIESSNVTVRNFIATGGPSYTVWVKSGSNNVVLEDGEIGPGSSSSCLYDLGTGNRFTRLHIHDCGSDSVKFNGADTLLEDSYLNNPGTNWSPGSHTDGVQMRGCTNCTIDGNNFYWPPSQPGNFHWSQTILIEEGSTGATISNNWLGAAGGYILNNNLPDAVATGNKFYTPIYGFGASSGSYAEFSDNVWECDGSPVSDPEPSCASF